MDAEPTPNQRRKMRLFGNDHASAIMQGLLDSRVRQDEEDLHPMYVTRAIQLLELLIWKRWETNKKSRLFTLPGEVRNMIAKVAMQDMQFEIIQLPSRLLVSTLQAEKILRVCRLTHQESQLLVYEHVIATAKHPEHLVRWAKGLHPALREMIKRMRLTIDVAWSIDGIMENLITEEGGWGQ
jgi:hypothetical protein